MKTLNRLLIILLLQIFSNECFADKFYWVGGTGNWEDLNHWSKTSGGIPNVLQTPNDLYDSVYFDANSFTAPGQVVTSTDIMNGASLMDFTGVQFNPTITGSGLWAYQHLIFSPALNWNIGLWLDMGYSGSIKTNGLALGHIVAMYGCREVILEDDLLCKTLNIMSGGLITQGYSITADSISIEPQQSFEITNLGSSVINVGSFRSHVGSYLSPDVLQFSDATLIINDTSNAGYLWTTGKPDLFKKVIAVSNVYIYTDSLSVESMEIQNNFTIVNGAILGDTLILNNPGYTVNFNSKLIFKNWLNAVGSGNYVQLSSNVTGEVIMDYGILCIDNLILNNIKASGGATFYAGGNSVDLGGNSGWQFTSCNVAPAGYYWVGNSGNWTDVNHWATSSGGTVFHTSLPGSIDDVYIDQNSFSTSGNSITVNQNANAHNFKISTTTPFDLLSNGSELNCSGSVIINAPVLWDQDLVFKLSSSNYSLIDAPGVTFGNFAEMSGVPVNFQSDINVSGTLDLTGAKSNGNSITCNEFIHHQQFGLSSSRIYANVVNIVYGAVSEETEFFLNGIDTSKFICGNSAMRFGNIHFLGNGLIDFFPAIDMGIRKLTVGNDLTINSSFFTDTLFLNNPGKTLTLNTGTTTTINSNLISAGNAINKVNLTTSGGFATISKSSGTVCLHDATLHFINTSGGALFYADAATCTNLGGNTGWQFIPCSISSDVWPGDANNDGVVSNFDLLSIGTAFGNSGSIRPSATIQFVAQPATDWNSYFNSGTNVKHADTNGDGLVDYSDTTAVIQNYGLTHALRISNALTGPEIYMVLDSDSASAGDTVLVDFYLGDGLNAVDNVYGLVFSLNFDDAQVVYAGNSFEYTNSWIGNNSGNLIGLQMPLPNEGRTDFALVRTDHNNITGSGLIGSCRLLVSNTNVGMAPLMISDAYVISSDESVLPLVSTGDTLSIDSISTGVTIKEALQELTIYPNPNSGSFRIKMDESVKHIQIFDIMGNMVWEQEMNSSSYINTKLENGFYMIKAQSGKTVNSIKMQVINN